MKKLIVKKGEITFEVLLDNKDFKDVTTRWRTPKWCARVCKKRDNLVYFQKRMPDGKLIELHRYIMGFPKGVVVDHINGNTLDNRRKNLRAIYNRANVRKGKVRVNNKSGYTGVFYRKDRRGGIFGARIRVNYKVISLGYFKTFKEAYNIRKLAEKKYQYD